MVKDPFYNISNSNDGDSECNDADTDDDADDVDHHPLMLGGIL